MNGRVINGVLRVDSIVDLPDESIRCAAKGSHVGFFYEDPALVEVEDSQVWGRIRAANVTHRCDCGRWRRDVVDLDDGEVLTVQYGGGTLMAAGHAPPRNEARAEYLRRVQARAATAKRSDRKRSR